jgi:hypothetical protein
MSSIISGGKKKMIYRHSQAGSPEETHQSKENGKEAEALEKAILLTPICSLRTPRSAVPLSVSILPSMFSLLFYFEDRGSMFF